MKNMLRQTLKLIFVIVFLFLDYGFLNPDERVEYVILSTDDPFENSDRAWVDSLYNKMSLDERIGQLFMVAAYTTPQQSNKAQIAELISKYHIGGLIFMKGTPVRQAMYTNYFQSLSTVPLMIAIDGEWGLAMRLDSTIAFPRQLMLGAITNNKLLYDMGLEIGRQCNRIGIHINFAPVVDVNNNPMNPVINSRSFGELKHNVAIKGDYYMTGMQDKRIVTTAKHFPGHGDTDADSHKSLPIIPHKKSRLDTLELYPFKYLINRSLTGVMVAHLYIPEIDRTKNQASTLSPKIVQDILINELGFKGLIFTDALNMHGVSKYYKPGELEIKALQAGNDVLLFPEDVPTAVAAIKAAIESGRLTEKMIEQRCKKILAAKYWMGLDTLKDVKIENLYEDLNTEYAQSLNKQLIRAAITVAKDQPKQLPIRQIYKEKIAYVSLLEQASDTFLLAASNYAKIRSFVVPANKEYQAILQTTLDSLSNYSMVIVNVVGSSQFPSRKYGVSASMVDIVTRIAQKHNVILVMHTNPYALDYFKATVPFVQSLVVAYDFSQTTQFETAQVLFGALPAEGKMPVGAGGISAGVGIQYKDIKRLRYGEPLDVGMSKKKLQSIDSIVAVAIASKATPGCQVLVAKQGVVVYHKAYGTMQYDSKQAVTLNTIYDLASITKSISSSIALMKLYDEGSFLLNEPISSYVHLDGLAKSGKDTISMKSILAHHAGLFPWIPFYHYLIKDFFNPQAKDLKSRKRSATHPFKVNETNFVRPGFSFIDSSISSKPSELYTVPIADNVYMNPAVQRSMYTMIFNSKVSTKKENIYSDLGFILIPEVVKTITKRTIDNYVETEFYQKIGAHTLCYNPLRYFPKQQIAPTEYDEVFRRQLLQGYVHDPAAAMLGGVSGHAGLFSTAHDLAKVCQMLLNKGYYGGEQFITSSTVELFTSCAFCSEGNRKAYGFDRAETDSTKADNTCKCTSTLSYGHTGFTGTVFWIDPAHDLVYIFLSNRVCPDADNRTLANTRVRARIQKVVYDALQSNVYTM